MMKRAEIRLCLKCMKLLARGYVLFANQFFYVFLVMLFVSSNSLAIA